MVEILDPRDAPHLFADAWNRRDVDDLAALFAEDAEFVNVVGLWWRKRRDIRKAHEYALKSFFREAQLIVDRTEVRLVKSDAAVVHAQCRLRGQRDVDETLVGERGNILLFVLERNGSSWAIVAAQNTEVIPGTETFAARGDLLEPVSYRKV